LFDNPPLVCFFPLVFSVSSPHKGGCVLPQQWEGRSQLFLPLLSARQIFFLQACLSSPRFPHSNHRKIIELSFAMEAPLRRRDTPLGHGVLGSLPPRFTSPWSRPSSREISGKHLSQRGSCKGDVLYPSVRLKFVTPPPFSPLRYWGRSQAPYKIAPPSIFSPGRSSTPPSPFEDGSPPNFPKGISPPTPWTVSLPPPRVFLI